MNKLTKSLILILFATSLFQNVFADSKELRCPTAEEVKALQSNGDGNVMTGEAQGVKWTQLGEFNPQQFTGWAMSNANANYPSDWMIPSANPNEPPVIHFFPTLICYLTPDVNGPAILAHYYKAGKKPDGHTCSFGGDTLTLSSIAWVNCPTGVDCAIKCD